MRDAVLIKRRACRARSSARPALLLSAPGRDCLATKRYAGIAPLIEIFLVLLSCTAVN